MEEKEIFVAKEVLKLIVETLHSYQSFKIHSLYEQLQEINEEFRFVFIHNFPRFTYTLTVMKLNCQILQRTLGDTEMKADRLKSVISEIDRMTEMMQEILTLSKAKKSEIILKEIETRPIIDKIVQDVLMYYSAEETNVEIENIEHVFADKTMVFEVFQNVIGNAVKYSSTQEFPKVSIKSEIVDDQVIYQISDNGIGIKKDDHDKMF
ncbi:ATP-binding protein [Algoriella xinjiangensis]|uniref:ATP-binding protein n=1 Tax=Algoriella xinjiangensis TaxID=684065 RepID=UPI000F641060|nr:HAMP domain-containing sensor histidine kinase [Algoriella xinjiangensis]